MKVLQETVEIYDKTTDIWGEEYSRPMEIKLWLSENPVEKYAIIDDVKFAWDDISSVFWTNDETGLTASVANNVVKHLSSPPLPGVYS